MTLGQISRNFVAFILIGLLLGCATGSNSSSDQYYESAYYDRNQAPKTLVPREPSSTESSTIEIDPTYLHSQADYHFSMAETYSLDGQGEKAIESFKSVLLYDQGSATVRLRLASEYVKLGKVTEAIEQAELALQIDPKKVEAYTLLGGLYSAIKTYDKAIKSYEKALEFDPENSDVPMYLGAVYAERKMYQKALGYFEKMSKMEDYPNPHLPAYYTGRVYVELKKYTQAEAAFKKAIKHKPDFSDAALSLAALFMRSGQREKAVSVYRQFQIENGPVGRISEVLAQIYLEDEEYDLALEQLVNLEELSDEPLNVKVRIALVLIEQKKYKEAIVKLTETLDAAPDSDKVRFYLAAVYEELQDFDKAISHFLKVPADSSFYADAVIHAAFMTKKMGQTDAAIAIVAKGIENKKDSPQMYALQASLMDDIKDYKGAATLLEGALAVFPESVQLTFYLGTVYDKLKLREKVVSFMKKVIELDPKHVQALNYLAYLYAETATNLAEAESLARMAASLDPKDGFILDTLGWVLYKQGKVNEAIPVLEAAHKVQPQESIIAEHLGDAYIKHQLVEKAKTMYQKAAELEQEPEKQKNLREKITSIEKQVFERPGRMPASLPNGN